MKKINSISLGSRTELPQTCSYLLVPGIVLFASVLTISNAQARDMYRVAPVEVVVYEGTPIDYSNQRDVIVIEETSSYGSYSNVVVVQDFTDDSSNQSQAVAYNKPAVIKAKPQTINKPQVNRPVLAKAKAKPAAVKNNQNATAMHLAAKKKAAQKKAAQKIIAKNTAAKNKQNQPTKTATPKEIANDAMLMAFYADVMKSQKKKISSRPAPIASIALKKTITKHVVQASPKPANTQMPKLASKSKHYSPNQVVAIKGLNKSNPKVQGKDPQLVAFYLDVFGKQNNNLSKNAKTSTKQAVKQILANKGKHKKSKINYQPKKVRLAKKASTSKDPELVAFYKQVFGNDVNSSSKHAPAVVNSNIKDPELVAFYEREFGKSMSKPKVVAKTSHKSPKIKIVSNSKSEKKRTVKKVKNKNTTSTAAVELQKLIDELTNKNMI